MKGLRERICVPPVVLPIIFSTLSTDLEKVVLMGIAVIFSRLSGIPVTLTEGLQAMKTSVDATIFQ